MPKNLHGMYVGVEIINLCQLLSQEGPQGGNVVSDRVQPVVFPDGTHMLEQQPPGLLDGKEEKGELRVLVYA